MSGAAIAADGLSYRHASRSRPAFRGVDLRVEPGEVVLITGDSGVGKSTLLSAIAGLLGDREDGDLAGALSVDGPVGMVLQDPDSQVIAARVGDDVAFGAENLGVAPDEIWPRVDEALELVGLNLRRDHPTAHLSGGQKQRLALAGVLAMGARVILLDEPTANLDPDGRRQVVEAVERVRARTNASVVIAEHRPHHWLSLSPTLYRLHTEGIEHLRALPDPPDVPTTEPLSGFAASDAAITLEELQPAYGDARTFMLPLGASSVLTGPNGSGKSTLAATIGGLVPPRKGEVGIHPSIRDGARGPVHSWRSSELARRIGTVFQDPEHQFAFRTVREELSHAPAGRGEELLERLRLGHLVEANPFTLSGGEKRRLSVATALAGAPRLLLLDEPTFGQDDASFLELIALIRDWCRDGRSVVSITHDELYCRALADWEVRIS